MFDSDSERESNSKRGEGEDNYASYWILRIEDEGMRDQFINDFGTMDINTMKEIVGQYKHSKPTASITVLQNRLQEWANQPSILHRKYHWSNTTQFKIRIKEIDTSAKTAGTKKVGLDLLVECKTRQKQHDMLHPTNGHGFHHD